jgi:hypothetical protein
MPVENQNRLTIPWAVAGIDDDGEQVSNGIRINAESLGQLVALTQ